jgi:methyltransferase-like protein/cyclopropane fatty-acyl-phospholipid synthase-like methyltransferase
MVAAGFKTTQKAQPIMSENTAYDKNAYPGFPYIQTHPDRLAALGHLYGMEVVPVKNCHVLELGCGEGRNLIPMAMQLPGSHFLGIDLAGTAIDKGGRLIRDLGLTNIQLRHEDLLKFECEPGAFDYIITHGLYSWVPPDVQEKILEIVQRGLAHQGIAYISYNALPGGHFRLMLREMMQYHTRSISNVEDRVDQGKAMIQFLSTAQVKPNYYAVLLKEEWEHRLSKRPPQVLIHDELGEFNENLYFHEFMARAARHKLQFLSEADFPEMHPFNLEPRVAELLAEFGEDVVAREQYLDFLKGRRFRQTLLCHDSLPIVQQFPLGRVAQLLFSSCAQSATPLFEPEISSPVQFLGPHQTAITAGHPLVKAALYCLEKNWPLPLPLNTLREKALQHLGSIGIEASRFNSQEDGITLCKTLFLSFRAGLLEFHSWSPAMAVKPGPCPQTSPLARIQAKNNEDRVTTLIHTSVEVTGSLERKLLQLLDGTRDRTSILSALGKAVQSGEALLTVEGKTISDPLEIGKFLEAGLEGQLEQLGRMGLLSA